MANKCWKKRLLSSYDSMNSTMYFIYKRDPWLVNICTHCLPNVDMQLSNRFTIINRANLK